MLPPDLLLFGLPAEKLGMQSGVRLLDPHKADVNVTRAPQRPLNQPRSLSSCQTKPVLQSLQTLQKTIYTHTHGVELETPLPKLGRAIPLPSVNSCNQGRALGSTVAGPVRLSAAHS